MGARENYVDLRYHLKPCEHMDLTWHQSNAFLGAGCLLRYYFEPTGSPKPVAPTQQQVRVVLLIMRAVLMRASDFGLQALHELFASL